MAYTASKERVVKNTAFLYFRTLLMLVIGVFTSRITLQALGIDNYGIVNVVSGFVGMFTIVSGSLTSACQRFITYELGKSDRDVQSVFSASMYIHLILCAVVLILAETIGLYFVNNNLNLPDGRLTAAQWVYQCSVATFMLSLINIPFNALIIAHEKMKVFAYISLLEAVLKLIVVILLLYLSTDKLILYALLGLASSVVVRLTFQVYCKKAFGEVIVLRKRIDKMFVRQIFGFAGWSFIGNSAWISSIQGVNIVINIFCGVAVNAARGIALMVENVITGFVNNFTTAVNPQITKLYAASEYAQLQSMVSVSMKMSFYLMVLLSLPIIVTADILLKIWFVDVPAYAPIFVRITMLTATVQAIGNPFMTLLLATGKIRDYQICAGLITFMNLPGSYLLLKLGESPTSVYLLALVLSIAVLIVRFIFIRCQTKLSLRVYVKELFKFTPVLVAASMCGWAVFNIMPITNLFHLAIYGLLTLVLNVSIIYLLGLNRNEKKALNDKLKERIGFSL